MSSILVVYGTTEGQTRKIAEFIANTIRAHGIEVETVDSATEHATQLRRPPGAAIVCASLHQHRYQSSVLHFVRHNRTWLAEIPTAFVSVSLTAVLTDEPSRDELRKAAESFFDEARWTPDVTLHVPGALRYTEYDYFKRLVMKLIARHHGGDTDTSRDHEYTDWDALTRFVQNFLDETTVRQPS